MQEKSKPKSDVLIPATVTAFVFEEEAAPVPALRQHAQKQQKEKTRWLNTPNTYLRVNVAEEQQGSAGSQRTKTTVWGWGLFGNGGGARKKKEGGRCSEQGLHRNLVHLNP